MSLDNFAYSKLTRELAALNNSELRLLQAFISDLGAGVELALVDTARSKGMPESLILSERDFQALVFSQINDAQDKSDWCYSVQAVERYWEQAPMPDITDALTEDLARMKLTEDSRGQVRDFIHKLAARHVLKSLPDAQGLDAQGLNAQAGETEFYTGEKHDHVVKRRFDAALKQRRRNWYESLGNAGEHIESLERTYCDSLSLMRTPEHSMHPTFALLLAFDKLQLHKAYVMCGLEEHEVNGQFSRLESLFQELSHVSGSGRAQ